MTYSTFVASIYSLWPSRSPRTLRLALLSAVCCATLVWPAASLAQNIQYSQNTEDQTLRSSLTVDPSTLGMSMQIPIRVYTGRGGTSLPVTLYYSSKVWRIQYASSSQNQYGVTFTATEAIYGDETASGWNSSLAFPQITGGTEIYDSNGSPLCIECDKNNTPPPWEQYRVKRLHVRMPDGSTHELRIDDTPFSGTWSPTGTFYAVDGSRMRYDTATDTLSLPDGSRYVFTIGNYHFIDRNGNKLSYNGQWTDTLGRVIGMPPLDNSAPVDRVYSVPGVNGTPANYTFRWRRLVDVRTDPGQPLRFPGSRTSAEPEHGHDLSPTLFGANSYQDCVCDGREELFNPVVLHEIVLPDNRSYKFTYNAWGEIDKVVLPNGGYERYDYSSVIGVNNLNWLYSQANRGVVQRWLSPSGTSAGEGTPWQYSSETDIGNAVKVTTTAPDLSRTERRLHLFGTNGAFGFEDSRLGRAFDERVFAPGGQMLRRKLTEWTQSGQAAGGWNNARRNPRVSKEVDIILDTGGDALAKTTTYQYDTPHQFTTGLNLASSGEYGYAAVSQATAQTGAIGAMPQGALIRTTELDYLDENSAYRDRNLLGQTTATRLKNAAGQVVAQSEVSYDEAGYAPLPCGAAVGWADPGTSVRGLPTTTRSWHDTTGAWVETHAQYDTCGNLRNAWDAHEQAAPVHGRLSQVEYSATYHRAYPTLTRSAVPDPSGQFGSTTALETNTAYDFHTGRVTSTTDANGKTTSLSYLDDQGNPDPLGRPRKVTRPDGGWTKYFYDRNADGDYINTQVLQNTAGVIQSSYLFFDGLGRPSRSFAFENQDPNNPFVTTDTEYDVMGRIKRVSLPYRTAGSASRPFFAGGKWAETAYDALGRVRTVTTMPDNAAVTTAYRGNLAQVTDQTGKSRRSETDSLGRLVSVVEFTRQLADRAVVEDPLASDHVSNYTYDVSGNLRKVEQGGQFRFFMYDSLGRLIRARNPEQGTHPRLTYTNALNDALTGNTLWSVAYGYDAAGNLTSRVDARNVETTYGYDALSRNTTVRYTDGTKDVDRHYDGAVNGLGRFHYFNWDQYNNARFETHLAIDEYDAVGRPKNYRQHFLTNGAASPAFTSACTYDLTGNVLTQTYPSGHTVSYSYDVAGRPTSFSGNLGDGVQRAYSSEVRYHESAGIEQERFGTQTPLYHKLRYNARGQLYDIRLSTYSLQANEWDWNRGAIVNYFSANYEWGGTPGADGSDTDNNGNLRRSTHWVPNDDAISGYSYTQQTYAYDSLNRLSSVAEQPGTHVGPGAQSYAQIYQYDRYGNRLIDAATWGAPEIGFEQDAADPAFREVPAPSNRLYAPGDGARAPSQKWMRYDAAGNLVFDAYTGQGARSYDAENRMTSAQDAYQNTSTYTYDADGRRVKRANAYGQTWQVYGMGGELLAEYHAGAAPFIPTKEYGYRGGALLFTATSGDPDRMNRFIKNLYFNALARDPSPAEAQQQTSTLTNAGVQGQAQLLTTARASARAIFESAEYAARGRTDAQYVTDLYNAYLQRGPDQGGLNFWVNNTQVNGRGATLNAFEVCMEFERLAQTLYGVHNGGDNQRVEHFVRTFYQGARGVDPTAAELQQQTARLNSAAAQGEPQVINEARQMGLEIFQATGYNSTRTNAEYVTDLYQSFLQRAPDAGGLNWWVGQVQAHGRAQVLAGFQQSTEFTNLSKTLYRETFWLVPDHLGTPRMVVAKAGTLAGVKRHDYFPFGEEIGAGVGGRATTQGYSQLDGIRLKFTGKERDAESGLDYFRARYYSSAQGRFTSPDRPFADQHAVNPQSWNLYTYVGNSPLVYTDPLGLWKQVECSGGATQCWEAEEGDTLSSLAKKLKVSAQVLVNHFGSSNVAIGQTFDVSGLSTDNTSVQVVDDDDIHGTMEAYREVFMGPRKEYNPGPSLSGEVGRRLKNMGKALAGTFGMTGADAVNGADVLPQPGGPDSATLIMGMSRPPLKPMHSLDQNTLQHFRGKSTEELIDSLTPGRPESLKVDSTGKIWNGHHRVEVLRERGIDVNNLPREPYP